MTEPALEGARARRDGTADEGPRVSVLAAAPTLMVEISDDPSAAGEPKHPTVHLHPGGQGAWVADMAVSLGAHVSMCAPLGGELGEPLRAMLVAGGISVLDSGLGAGTGAAVVDLRGAGRQTLATMPSPPLGRHDLDDLYGMALVDALESSVAVITGVDPATLVPADFFGRLAKDVRAAGIPVVADLSGDAALAVIEEGPTVLKMSHEEVIAAGLADHDNTSSLVAAGHRIVAAGASAVVISRAEKNTLLVTAAGARFAAGPAVHPVVHRGAGDSMTAGLAVGLGRGLDLEDALRLGAAAGALNVARRGLGSGRREQIERLATRIVVSDEESATAHGED